MRQSTTARCSSDLEDAGAEQMAHVRRHAVDGAPLGIERHRRVARAGRPVRDPEGGAESLGDLVGPRPEVGSTVPAEGVEQLGSLARRASGESLNLAESDRPDRLGPVCPADGIARVLPSLVRECAAGPVVIREEAPGVGRNGGAQPPDRRLEVGHERRDVVRRHAGTPRVMQERDPQRRRIDRAVVARRQHKPLVAANVAVHVTPQLVDDLAGFLRSLRRRRSTPAGGRAQRASRGRSSARPAGGGSQPRCCRDRRG